MTELTYIANKHTTDKGTEWSKEALSNVEEKGIRLTCCHGFTEYYDQYFSKYKTKHPVILEIGVWTGGSVAMINEYYHGDCEIYGIDIDNDFKTIENIGENVHFILGNQADVNFLKELTDFLDTNNIKFDFIIDDGSHVPDHIMLTYNYLYKYVKKDGFYIIEDIETSYRPEFNDDITSDEKSALSFFTKFTNYHIFAKEINDKLHKDIKNIILYNTRNMHVVNTFETEMSMTLLVFFNNE